MALPKKQVSRVRIKIMEARALLLQFGDQLELAQRVDNILAQALKQTVRVEERDYRKIKASKEVY